MSFPQLLDVIDETLFLSRLAEPVVYTPPGGVAQSVRGIVSEQPVDVEGLDPSQSRIQSTQTVLALRLEDLTAGQVESGARVVLSARGNVEYEVRAPAKPDDGGLVKCFLRRVSGA